MKKFKYAYQVGGLWGDVRTRIPRIAKLGYDAVEVAGVTLTSTRERNLRKSATARALQFPVYAPTALNWIWHIQEKEFVIRNRLYVQGSGLCR